MLISLHDELANQQFFSFVTFRIPVTANGARVNAALCINRQPVLALALTSCQSPNPGQMDIAESAC
jgi:hypothetical protein